MRFLQRTRESNSPEEIAAATRLDALAKRGWAEVAAYPVQDDSAKAEGAKRLFRLPDEISSERDRA